MQVAAFLIAALLAPAATTGPAESVSPNAAVVTGTVDPNGEATTYQVEYGTSTSYGVTTPPQDAGSGGDPVGVRVTLNGLTARTTYHYRVVATNASGTARGADRTLRTTAPPTIASRAATGVGPLEATLNAGVNPQGLPTTVRFEIGTSTAYGASTPEQGIGAGTSAVSVSAPVGGLRPDTRYNFRAVATNAAGVSRGPNRTFTTARAPTGVSMRASTLRPVYGTGMTMQGTVSGVSSATPVALEKQDFPYTGPFTQVATATTDRRGAYRLTAAAMFVSARVRVVTRTAVVAASPPATVSVAVKVGARVQRLRGRRVRVTGATWPAVPRGRISLQRQTRSGRWILVQRATPRALSGNRSRYSFIVRRRSRALTYRAVVLARDGGAHVPGTSRSVRVPRR